MTEGLRRAPRAHQGPAGETADSVAPRAVPGRGGALGAPRDRGRGGLRYPPGESCVPPLGWSSSSISGWSVRAPSWDLCSPLTLALGGGICPCFSYRLRVDRIYLHFRPRPVSRPSPLLPCLGGECNRHLSLGVPVSAPAPPTASPSLLQQLRPNLGVIFGSPLPRSTCPMSVKQQALLSADLAESSLFSPAAWAKPASLPAAEAPFATL